MRAGRSGARGLADAHLRLLWALIEKARGPALRPPRGPAPPERARRAARRAAWHGRRARGPALGAGREGARRRARVPDLRTAAGAESASWPGSWQDAIRA
jgi:hypothetical protein